MAQLIAGILWGGLGFFSTYSGAPLVVGMILAFSGYLVTLEVLNEIIRRK